VLTVFALAIGIFGIVGIRTYRESTFAAMVELITTQLVGHLQIHAAGYQNDPALDVVISDPVTIEARLKDTVPQARPEFGAGRLYTGLVASYAVDELTSLSSTAIVNVFDPGLLWVPAVEVWLEQHVLRRAGGFVPVAAGVDVDRFRALTLQGSNAFPSLTTGFGARSEYGLQPYGAFVQLGAYLP